MSVLLLSNLADQAEALRKALQASGYRVEIHSASYSGNFDSCRAVVLHCLPKEYYSPVLWSLRKGGMNQPIIAIQFAGVYESATSLLDAGADVVLHHPLQPELLVAQVRALVKRRDFDRQEDIRIGALRLSPSAHEVYVNETVVPITGIEFAILHQLMRRQGVVISKTALGQLPESSHEELSPGSVEVHIHNLRKKLGTGLIRTVRSAGYSIKF
jgi:two-component system, OmpR family, response regulator QseB